MSNNTRHSGIVKFFNSQKGYGFIIPFDGKPVNPNGKAEIFVHHSAIKNEGGFKSLAESEHVEYTLVQGPKGVQAADVTGPNGAPVHGDPSINRLFFTQEAFNMAFNNGFIPYNQMPFPGVAPQYFPQNFRLPFLSSTTMKGGYNPNGQFGSSYTNGVSYPPPNANNFHQPMSTLRQSLNDLQPSDSGGLQQLNTEYQPNTFSPPQANNRIYENSIIQSTSNNTSNNSTPQDILWNESNVKFHNNTNNITGKFNRAQMISSSVEGGGPEVIV